MNKKGREKKKEKKREGSPVGAKGFALFRLGYRLWLFEHPFVTPLEPLDFRASASTLWHAYRT